MKKSKTHLTRLDLENLLIDANIALREHYARKKGNKTYTQLEQDMVLGNFLKRYSTIAAKLKQPFDSNKIQKMYAEHAQEAIESLTTIADLLFFFVFIGLLCLAAGTLTMGGPIAFAGVILFIAALVLAYNYLTIEDEHFFRLDHFDFSRTLGNAIIDDLEVREIVNLDSEEAIAANNLDNNPTNVVHSNRTAFFNTVARTAKNREPVFETDSLSIINLA